MSCPKNISKKSEHFKLTRPVFRRLSLGGYAAIFLYLPSLAILSFWSKEQNFNHQNTGGKYCHMGHSQQATGRKTNLQQWLCQLPSIQRVFPIFSMMQTLGLPDSRKGKGIITYRPARTIDRVLWATLLCPVVWKMWLIHADPKSQKKKSIRFGMVWQCLAGIWSRALKDLA